MTATRTYHSPARLARRQRTRQAIIDAFITQLGDPGRAVLSPVAAARAAGVSIRTVHHYFPDADAQLAGVAAEVEARLFPQPPPLPQTPAELPDLVTAVYHGSEGQLPLLRAMVTSSIGPQILQRAPAERLNTRAAQTGCLTSACAWPVCLATRAVAGCLVGLMIPGAVFK